MEPRFVVLRHDCEVDGHSYAIYGPFDSQQAADDWVERTDAWLPSDGGYAIAAVLQAIVGDDELLDPADREGDEGDEGLES